MIKTWFADPLIRNTIILCILFALIIHILFSIAAPCDFLIGKWSAGDILTYVSTISLGLLAIWQNQRFKEENDKAQERLEKQNKEAQERIEKLTCQANELAIVSKIIETEASRIEQTNQAFDKLYSHCDVRKIGSLYLNNGLNPLQCSAALNDWGSEMLTSFNEVLFQLGRDTCIDIRIIFPQTFYLVDAATKFLDAIKNGNAENCTSEMADLKQKQQDFLAARAAYFLETDAQYRRLVYGNMSLLDIRQAYCKIDQRVVMEEVMRKEKGENAVN